MASEAPCSSSRGELRRRRGRQDQTEDAAAFGVTTASTVIKAEGATSSSHSPSPSEPPSCAPSAARSDAEKSQDRSGCRSASRSLPAFRFSSPAFVAVLCVVQLLLLLASLQCTLFWRATLEAQSSQAEALRALVEESSNAMAGVRSRYACFVDRHLRPISREEEEGESDAFQAVEEENEEGPGARSGRRKTCRGRQTSEEEYRVLVDFRDKFAHTQQSIQAMTNKLLKTLDKRVKRVAEVADDVLNNPIFKGQR
ncbi:hypothetical protein BESB_003590 [Besnoitia besnoiti]|uniref:Uncharacterized protein n=1 Tax=Besnoitia besnoiti TaxID=94643 RepID=A0A2A9MHJ9_BESBE|nr:hypothetical protein BESB_003590 [Besnoitia besnoiti]PFH38018.1 hypothetical protein BESB_003590 [Besnoitia besnoiti]